MLAWEGAPGKIDSVVLKNKTVDFYDPVSGCRTSSVPIPQKVLDRVAGGQWSLQQWQGDKDSVLFPMAAATGGRVEWLDAHGDVARGVTLHHGLEAPGLQLSVSPDGHYLAESTGTTLAVYDLLAQGQRIAQSSPDITPIRDSYLGWTGKDEIAIAVDETPTDGVKIPATGHSPVYKVLSPELKVVQEATFSLPADPRGYCASWPVTWAPTEQFPGAFVP